MKQTKKYTLFSTINGEHPLRQAVPGGYIDYAARRRRNGCVFYFNYALARNMGLIRASHPDEMNPALQRSVLDTFSIQIINEYDLEHNVKGASRDRLPGKYMATRYLQIQHPGKLGTTSGDGRGLWNGYVDGPQGVWDVSSCGTGTTALSPGVVQEGRSIQTGDDNVSYGNGRASLWDGVCAAIMSEIYHHTGIATERTLAIISYPDGSAINVRATLNLLRPAHFFLHIKQNNLTALEGLIEYYFDRQVSNGLWPRIAVREKRYRYFLDTVTRDFASMAARFESDYIFCWLDWDGDNILMNGGIIDYGSLRQFGLFHHAYRYDDVERMSTTITEQKNKARYIVQTFAQIVESLIKGKKKNIKAFSQHTSLKLFDKVFRQSMNKAFLYRMGIDKPLIEPLCQSPAISRHLQNLKPYYDYFERAKSYKGLYPVSDGISWDAVFCMRDCLREMPKNLLNDQAILKYQDFIAIIRSRYANDQDIYPTAYRRRNARNFQKHYQKLVHAITKSTGIPLALLLSTMVKRSAMINRYDRITGDSIIHVAKHLINASRSMSRKSVLKIFNNFVDAQILSPEYHEKYRLYHGRYSSAIKHGNKSYRSSRFLKKMLQSVVDHREGL